MSQVSTQAKHRAADTPSTPGTPGELEHEIEVTRERLAGTLDQLVYRIKPSTILSRTVADIKGHFVDAEGGLRTGKVVALAGAGVGVVAFFVTVRKLTIKD